MSEKKAVKWSDELWLVRYAQGYIKLEVDHPETGRPMVCAKQLPDAAKVCAGSRLREPILGPGTELFGYVVSMLKSFVPWHFDESFILLDADGVSFHAPNIKGVVLSASAPEVELILSSTRCDELHVKMVVDATSWCVQAESSHHNMSWLAYSHVHYDDEAHATHVLRHGYFDNKEWLGAYEAIFNGERSWASVKKEAILPLCSPEYLGD